MNRLGSDPRPLTPQGGQNMIYPLANRVWGKPRSKSPSSRPRHVCGSANLGFPLREEFVRGENRDFAGRVIGFIPRDNRADASLRLCRKVLYSVLEILEARGEGGLDFHFGHRGNPN